MIQGHGIASEKKHAKRSAKCLQTPRKMLELATLLRHYRYRERGLGDLQPVGRRFESDRLQ